MTVPVVYDEVIEICSKEDERERVEIDDVTAALARLGYRPVQMPVNLSVDESSFRDLGARLVFNCVDSLDDSGRFGHIVPSILDDLGLPYTGSSTDAIYLTSDKVIAKRLLRAHGLRTPRWCSVERAAANDVPFDPPYILKHVWEDASFGLDEHSVLHRKADLVTRASSIVPERRGECFVEAFVEGREFNVSLISSDGGARALPPMEIEFHDFGESRPRIVDFKTKWEIEPGGGGRIERRFDFAAGDAPLVGALSEMARRCWDLFHLGGYARVDFRVDREGTPWILEINTNPYLGNDSSFLAAAARGGLDFDDVIRIVVDDALGRNGAASDR